MSFPWNEHVIGRQTYSLTHLKPFTMPVTPKAEGAPTYKLYVSFGIHTVSKEWDTAHPADHKIEFGAEARCFCPIRHGHSLYLPTIVRQASAGKAYFSQRQNFLLIEILPGLDGPYAVFFNIERSKSASFDAAMFVVSAYEKPNLPKITFATLVSKTARGEAVSRPKKIAPCSGGYFCASIPLPPRAAGLSREGVLFFARHQRQRISSTEPR